MLPRKATPRHSWPSRSRRVFPRETLCFSPSSLLTRARRRARVQLSLWSTTQANTGRVAVLLSDCESHVGTLDPKTVVDARGRVLAEKPARGVSTRGLD